MTEETKKAAAMHEATDIGTLIERVEAASGPDREIDIHLWALITGATIRITPSCIIVAERPGEPTEVAAWVDAPQRPWNVFTSRDDIQRYTGSIDAAVSLVEKVLPGWTGRVGFGGVPALAMIEPRREDRRTGSLYKHYGAKAPTAPLAILSALLLALAEDPLPETKGIAAA